MEDKKKGGYSAESKTPRPRRPRVSGKVYGSHSGQPERIYDSNRSERYEDGERPHRSYGDRPQRPYGDRPQRYSDQGRPRRSYGEHGDNQDKPHYGDRPQRSYGDRPQRPYGDRPQRRFEGGEDRPQRSYGDRPQRPYGDRPQRGYKSQGPRKPFHKDFGDEQKGIGRMISRRPQVSDLQGHDNVPVTGTFQEEVRLNKFIANSGVCSRREADQMIQAGVVSVNGEVVTELGTKINVLRDEVRYDGQLLQGEKKVYIVMNKPRGYVTTASDPHADKTVMDLLKGCEYRVFPVGRLDKNTTGVLMLTNDGEIAGRLTHPSYDKKKIYQVILDRPVSQEDFDSILSGITLGDGDIKADELEYIDERDHSKIGIEIHSGKNRIVRRIFESLGYEVKALDRVYFAGLTKKGIKKGEWRYLSEGEANVLKMGAYL